MGGIVFGCIVPHPPLMVPDVGRGEEREISKTIEAMKRLAGELERHHPESAVMISPHGAYHYDAMGTATSRSSGGNMREWGSRGPDYYFDNDLELVAAIEEEAKASDIPLRSIGEKGYDLDHGVLAPMFYLIEGMGGVRLVPITFAWLPLETHFAFGQAIRKAAERIGRGVAVIASGDLSHRLIPTAPAGYDPMGRVFDEKLTSAIASYDVDAILNMDEDLIEHAGECGLRSIVILLGTLSGLVVKPDVISYEGPFGVGYCVASFEVEGG